MKDVLTTKDQGLHGRKRKKEREKERERDRGRQGKTERGGSSVVRKQTSTDNKQAQTTPREKHEEPIDSSRIRRVSQEGKRKRKRTAFAIQNNHVQTKNMTNQYLSIVVIGPHAVMLLRQINDIATKSQECIKGQGIEIIIRETMKNHHCEGIGEGPHCNSMRLGTVRERVCV